MKSDSKLIGLGLAFPMYAPIFYPKTVNEITVTAPSKGKDYRI